VIISKGISSVEKRSESMFGLANLTIWKAKQSRLLFSSKVPLCVLPKGEKRNNCIKIHRIDKGMNKNLLLKGMRAASENE
jgi:hypothetical protein